MKQKQKVMSKIVVCKKFRLVEISQGEFKNNDMKKLERSSVKISEEDVKNFNAGYKTSGIIYEIDEKATKERNTPKVDRDALKLEATNLKLEFADNIPTPKLIELINKAKS